MPTPIGIQTNVSALMAQRSLLNVSGRVEKSIGRLSSGLRILSAADDAAGVAVAKGMEGTVRSLTQAMRNANDGVALLQTAEGAYVAVSDILIRMRELAIQGANDTLTNVDRSYINAEYQLLVGEIDRISAVTEFNGIQLLDGTAGDGDGNVVFQVGARNTVEDRIQVSLPEQSTLKLGVAFTATDTLLNAQTAIDAIDFALSVMSTDRAALGASMNKLDSAMENLGVTVEKLSDGLSRIRDVDVAAESTEFASAQVLMQAGVSMLSQATQIPNLALQLLQG